MDNVEESQEEGVEEKSEEHKEEKTKIVRMSKEEMQTFVREMVQGKIFTSLHVQDQSLLHLIFMPLCLGALADMSEEYVKEIGIIWEYLSKAGPRSINGYPMFLSMRVMHREDWEKIFPAVERAEKALLEVEVEG